MSSPLLFWRRPLKEGGLSVDSGWFQLWATAEIEQLNRNYHVEEFAPGFFGFGSSSDSELLAFDAGGRVFMIPFNGMSADEAKPAADIWSEFVERMER